MNIHRTLTSVVLGLVVLCGADSTPAQGRSELVDKDILREAELKMLRSKLSTQEREIRRLNSRIAELRSQIARLEELCRQAGIAPPTTQPTAKAPTQPAVTAGRRDLGSVLALLETIPRKLMPPGEADKAQKSALADWAKRDIAGKTLMVQFTTKAKRLSAGGLALEGWIPSPLVFRGRRVHCRIQAVFSGPAVKAMLKLRLGKTVKVAGRLCEDSPLLAASGTVKTTEKLKIAGRTVPHSQAEEEIDGWTRKTAILLIRLVDCELLK